MYVGVSTFRRATNGDLLVELAVPAQIPPCHWASSQPPALAWTSWLASSYVRCEVGGSGGGGAYACGSCQLKDTIDGNIGQTGIDEYWYPVYQGGTVIDHSSPTDAFDCGQDRAHDSRCN